MDRNTTSPARNTRPRLQTRKLIIGTVALFTLACLIALGALFKIAHQLNHGESEKSTFYAEKALQQRLDASRQFISSYAVWDAAYQHLNGTVDKHWAYTEKNVGESLYTASGYEGVFVVDQQRTGYALFKGQPSDSPAGAYLDAPLTPIVDEARALAASRQQLSHYTLFNGWPAVLTAAAIRPDADVLNIDAQTTAVMLFVDQLTQPKLDKLASDAGLTGMHIVKTGSQNGSVPSLPLDNTGYSLQWSPPHPGEDRKSVV